MNASLILLTLLATNINAAQITSDQLRLNTLKKENGLLIIDVRTPNDFAKGHIQGAKNIPASAVSGAGLPQDAHVVVYCGDESCPLSATAAQALEKSGYKNVSHLEGGFSDWLGHSYPSATGGDKKARGNKRRHKGLKDARKNLANLVPVDVRPKRQFKAGHLKRALNAPLEELESHYIDIPKDKELLVYDRSAKRSKQAYDKLKAAGFQVTELQGGFAGWAKRRNPVDVK